MTPFVEQPPAPGFADPVFDGQRAFRAVLTAMARPGTVARVEMRVTPPPSLSLAAASLALTLLDRDTPLWLDAAAGSEETVGFLAFHCGAPVVRDPAAAAFALIADAPSMPALAHFAQGDDRYPDESATLIVEVAGLAAGAPLALRGPGIETSVTIAPRGLPEGFPAWLALNRAQFPLGVDVILTCGADMIGLPRAVEVEA